MSDTRRHFTIPILNVLSEELRTGSVIDPICGMTVDPKTAIYCDQDGTRWFFCCEHCRVKFLNPEMALKKMPAGTKYFCPMCPGVNSDHPASCPVCGMALEPELTTVSDFDSTAELNSLKFRLFVATVCTIPIILLSMGPMIGLPIGEFVSHRSSAFIQMILATIAVGWSGWSFWIIGAKSFFTRQWNMFTLILLGVGAAFGFSLTRMISGSWHDHELYFESATVITTLILLGQVLEHNARRQTGQAIRDLLQLSPATAHLFRDNQEIDIPVSTVVVGNVLRVRPGEHVPVDGTVLSNALKSTSVAENDEFLTTIDEAMLSGEPMPVPKSPGDAVIGGTINQSGSFLMRADRVGRETILAQIVDLVSTAQRSRAPIQRLVDQVAKWFVPIILMIASVTFVLWLVQGGKSGFDNGLTNAMAVLIIACPCALGLATPMAITVGMGRGARDGILYRDAESLEILGRIDTLFLDKTGTLTEGRPSVAAIIPQAGHSEEAVLAQAAAVEQHSEHPLGRAVVAKARQLNLQLKSVDAFRVLPGIGVNGRVDGHEVEVGFDSDNEEVRTFRQQRRPVLTSATVLVDGTSIGEIDFTDVVRETAKQAIQDLTSLSVQVAIVTGDHRIAANRVATELGILESSTYVSLKPDEKLSLIMESRKQGHCVAMAGDGINDAPALAASDVGVSLGTGTDIAKQSASVILVKPDLCGIAKAIRLSRSVSTNIRQNLVFAFAYNVIGVPIAAGILYPAWGITMNPMLAALAMSLSSVSVIANSLRLRTISLTSPQGGSTYRPGIER